MTPSLNRRTVLNIAGVVVLIALIAPFAVYAVPQSIGATQSYVVLSGSMTPTIQPGDVIFVYDRKPSNIDEGDVITYNLEGERTEVTTHRVVDVVRTEDGERVFVTKGDANEDPDPYRVPPEAVIGAMPVQNGIQARIPYLGHALMFAQSKRGIALLVFLPAGLLVVSEVWDLYQHATAGGDDDGDAPAEAAVEATESDDPAAPASTSASEGE
jgi:signal peptidase